MFLFYTMTEQIVIKLNKKKFGPLLDFLMEQGENLSTSYSACVGKTLLFSYLYFTKKIDFLGNKTQFEYFKEKSPENSQAALISFFKKYKNFLNSN